MSTLAKRLLVPILIVLLLTMIASLTSRYSSLEWFVQNDRWLRETIRAKPAAAIVIGFFVYVAMSLVPGTAGKSIILGWLYGLLAGVLIVNAALVAAALVAFLLSRHYLQSAVQSRFGLYLRPLQQRMADDGAVYLLALRLAHAPFTLMNYAAGAGTNVSFRTFWWTTQLGLLPGNIVFVFAGTRLPTLEELLQKGPLGLLDGPMIAALIGTVFLPWVVRKVIRRAPPGRKTVQQLPDQNAGNHGQRS